MVTRVDDYMCGIIRCLGHNRELKNHYEVHDDDVC